VTTAKGQANLLDLPSLENKMQFPLQGTVSAAFCKQDLPNNLFFALKENFSLKLMLQTGEMNFPNAHQAEIRAIEHTNYQNMEFVFSAGLDGKLKVWTLDRV